jgi:hypothetical protein
LIGRHTTLARAALRTALAGGRSAAFAGLAERGSAKRRAAFTLRSAARLPLPAKTRVAHVVPRSLIRAAWLGLRSRPHAPGWPLRSAVAGWWRPLRRPAARALSLEGGAAASLACRGVEAWNIPLLPWALLLAAAQRRPELLPRLGLVLASRLPGSLSSPRSWLTGRWPLPGLRSAGYRGEERSPGLPWRARRRRALRPSRRGTGRGSRRSRRFR